MWEVGLDKCNNALRISLWTMDIAMKKPYEHKWRMAASPRMSNKKQTINLFSTQFYYLTSPPSVAFNIFLSFRFLQSVLDLWCVSQIGEIKMDWPKWETAHKTTNYQQSIFQHQICWGNFFSLLLSFMAAVQKEIIFKEFIFTSNKIFLIVMKILVEYWYKITLYFSSLKLWKWLNLGRK